MAGVRIPKLLSILADGIDAVGDDDVEDDDCTEPGGFDSDMYLTSLFDVIEPMPPPLQFDCGFVFIATRPTVVVVPLLLGATRPASMADAATFTPLWLASIA